MLTVRSELPRTVPALGARFHLAPFSAVAPLSTTPAPFTLAPFTVAHATVSPSTVGLFVVGGGCTARRTGLPDRVG